jgi:hypothetical protein
MAGIWLPARRHRRDRAQTKSVHKQGSCCRSKRVSAYGQAESMKEIVHPLLCLFGCLAESCVNYTLNSLWRSLDGVVGFSSHLRCEDKARHGKSGQCGRHHLYLIYTLGR